MLGLLATLVPLLPAPPPIQEGAGQAEAGDGARATGTAERVDALAVHARYRRMAAEPLWPGFEPLAVPLAIADGERTALFGHPAPPEEFRPAPGPPGVHWMEGVHEDVRANSSIDLGGARTATLLLDPAAPSPGGPAAVAMHEAFHVFQDLRHPSWRANEAALFEYPVEDSVVMELRRLELEALRRAESALTPEDARGWAQRALRYRDDRHLRLARGPRDYEREVERYEGLAQWVQDRCTEDAPAELPEGGFAPDAVRARCYATGAAMARLLDRFDKGWREAFDSAGDRHLDDALRSALGKPQPGEPPPDFTDEERVAISNEAVLDTARLRNALREIRRGLREQPGWTLEVHAPEEAPLFPQGFDPLNVRRLGPLEILHERWLRAGNLTGELEVRGVPAATHGVGDHPLFQGIARVLVTGLAEEPRIVVRDRGVTIEAPGVTGRFERATVDDESAERRWIIEIER